MRIKVNQITKLVYDEGSVGWGLWILLFLVFAWPGAALVLYFTYDTIPYAARVASGIFMGGVMAAIATWILNDILFRLVVRPRYIAQEAERKKEKKKAKRK